jgi:uncharacterized repeat protein (TIGR03803 family)
MNKSAFALPMAVFVIAVAVISVVQVRAQTEGAPPPAQTFKLMHSFDNTDGQNPTYAALVQGLDGNLYGTTEFGGANTACNPAHVGCGTVFKISTAGTLTTLWSFCQNIPAGCPDGSYPLAAMILGVDGNLYGTTSSGGAHGLGSVFKITPAGALTTIYSFCAKGGCADGYDPSAPLFLGADGDFYGTTVHGGTGGCGGCHGGGVFFKLTPAGVLTTLYSFCKGTCTDGSYPSVGVIQGNDGNFYGTTAAGGTTNAGTVFKISSTGVETTLYTFCSLTGCTDGINSYSELVQGTDGNFYGTTNGDDSNGGNVFKITPQGKLTTLHSFTTSLGAVPLAGLVLANDGSFYGTTFTNFHDGNCCGNIFKITAAGKYTPLLLLNGTNGNGPYELTQDTNGVFYGETHNGGAKNDGTVFSISEGLGKFVGTVPIVGKEGVNVFILGTSLTGATAVSFNGTPATFTVVSATEIKATVPAGAKTGKVSVTTPAGTFSTKVVFKVKPLITSITPTSGPVTTPVTITGTELSQATAVTFNGVKATTFTVNSDTEVVANVPTGATTGKIGVTTPGGTGLSTTVFTVTP